MSRDIRFRVTDEEYNSIDSAARGLGLGGQSPASVFSAMTVRQRAGAIADGMKGVIVLLDRVEYELAQFYGEAKGHAGPDYAAAALHYSLFQIIAKYPLNEKQKSDFKKKFAEKYHSTDEAEAIDDRR
jgi:hypothetical protein